MSWQACVDYTESSPAFLIIIGIPVSYSIADRFALGFIRPRGRKSVQWPRARN